MKVAAIAQQQGQNAPEMPPAPRSGLWPTTEQISATLGAPLGNVAEHWPTVSDAMAAQGLASRPCVIAALATIGVEVGSFLPIHEYGDNAYFTRMYEGRGDLGNVYPGDGARFAGRGFVQLTGRANYRYYGNQLGIDLESGPDRALEPGIAAAVLALYFRDHGICSLAEAGAWTMIRRRINGGENGLAEFLAYVEAFEALA